MWSNRKKHTNGRPRRRWFVSLCDLWSRRRWFFQFNITKYFTNQCYSSLWTSIVRFRRTFETPFFRLWLTSDNRLGGFVSIIFVVRSPLFLSLSLCLSLWNTVVLLASIENCHDEGYVAFDPGKFPLWVVASICGNLFRLLSFSRSTPQIRFHSFFFTIFFKLYRNFHVRFVKLPSNELHYRRGHWMMSNVKRIPVGDVELWRYLTR